MPANVVSIANSRRHNTRAEIMAAARAEAELSREKVTLSKPVGLKKNDPAVNAVWDRTVKRMRGLSLLDDLDSDTLLQYCKIAARLDELNQLYQEAMPWASS